MFRSESIDQSGSRADNIGFYTIRGFEPFGVTPPGEMTQALYLNDGSLIINCALTIDGHTFIGGNGIGVANRTIVHNQQTGVATDDQNSYYDGQFILNQNAGASAFLANERFRKGAAYFQGGTVNFSQYLQHGHSSTDNIFARGFGGSNVTFNHTSSPATMSAGTVANNATTNNKNLAIFADDVVYVPWHQDHRNWKLMFGANCSLVYRPSSNFSTSPLFYGGNPARDISRDGIDREDVLEALGINWPASCNVVLSDDILSYRQILTSHTTAGSVSGAVLQGMFTNVNIPKYKGWLVVQTAHDAQFTGGGGDFNGRAIVIQRHPGNAITAGSMPSVGPQGLIVWYVPPNDHPILGHTVAEINNGHCIGNFRGLIFNAARNTRLIFAAGNQGWNINGSLYSIGNRIELGSAGMNGRITINFNQDIIDTIKVLDIIECTDDEAPPADLNLRRIAGTVPTVTMRGRGY